MLTSSKTFKNLLLRVLGCDFNPMNHTGDLARLFHKRVEKTIETLFYGKISKSEKYQRIQLLQNITNKIK